MQWSARAQPSVCVKHAPQQPSPLFLFGTFRKCSVVTQLHHHHLRESSNPPPLELPSLQRCSSLEVVTSRCANGSVTVIVLCRGGMDGEAAAQIHEILPKSGLVVSEKGQLTEVTLTPGRTSLAIARAHYSWVVRTLSKLDQVAVENLPSGAAGTLQAQDPATQVCDAGEARGNGD